MGYQLFAFKIFFNKQGEGDGVRKSLVRLIFSVIVLSLSTAIHAMGMGGINVTSALGQPLQADIELVAVGKAEREGLVARLAPAEAFKNAGLDYPYGNKIKFHIETRADGEPYLQVTSEQPISDPFVSLLVELTWPSGKLLREYTFLLDPPGYVPEQPAQSDVRVVAPAVSVEPAVPAETSVIESAVEPEAVIVSEEQLSPVEPAASPFEQTPPMEAISDEQIPSEEAAPVDQAATTEVEAFAEEPEQGADSASLPEAEPLSDLTEWMTVPRGSTMYELADQYKQSDISVERMLVALYRANADEFGGKNMNRIKAGKILRLPDEDTVVNVTQSDAVKEIRVQAADWNAYRQKLASATPATSEPQSSQQVAVGKISSSVIDKAPVAKETAKEVLKLSKGDVPGDQAMAANGKGMSEQDKKNAAQEEAIAKAKAVDEEKMRAAMLQENLQDIQRLAQLKSEAAAKSAASPAPAPKVDAAKPLPTPALKVVTRIEPQAKPAPELDLVDQILEEPMYLAGVLVVLLGLGGLGFMLVRRKKKSFDEDGVDSSEDVGAITGRMAAPVVPSPETGDFTQTVVTSTSAGKAQSQEPESVDPISEADLFLSFGRDGQAEEILKDALKTMPSNHQIHLKLLGIYSSRQDADSFGAIARVLKDTGDEYAWEQAVEMGRKLEPSNPLYGGAGSMEATGSATVQMAAFDVAGASVAETAEPSSVLDFDLNAAQGRAPAEVEQNLFADMESTTILSSPVSAAEQATSMDFDITSTQPSMSGESSSPSPDEIIFDVTGSHLTASKPGGDSDGGMAFTLDFPVEQPAKPAQEPAGAGLAGISLNFGDAPVSAENTSGSKDEHWQEVATKLDLAKAYQEMGDSSGAMEILDEVMREGDAEQRATAKALLSQLS